MVKNALGLIETVGLSAAIEAADAAVKAANIDLIGYELTKGGGMVVVKLSGDVGAIKAAVEAGASAATKVGRVWATHIIPRPHQEIAGVVETRETKGRQNAKTAITCIGSAETSDTGVADIPAIETNGQESDAGMEAAALEQTDTELEQQVGEACSSEPQKKVIDICNLCGDPACPRKKGDPKVTCVHWEKHIKEDE